LRERIIYFLDLPSEREDSTATVLALWIILTYVYPAWGAVPYLHFGGPLGSGKSRGFEVIERLAFRPLSSSSLTAPAMFRTLHQQGGTLLLDEAERLKNTSAPETGELLAMLLAGYKRGGKATRLETIGDSYQTVNFDVFGPKALACIAGLPPVLASRCIKIMMLRATKRSAKPRRRIDATPLIWRQLRDDLFTMALEYGPAWLSLAANDAVCPAMSGRDYELWQPLLALAHWLDENGTTGLQKCVEQHALGAIEDSDEDIPDVDVTLLQILANHVRQHEAGRSQCAGRGWPWPTAKEILEEARAGDGTTFKRWTERGVQSRLKSYGIPKAHKNGDRREYKDVNSAMLRRIEERYTIDLGLGGCAGNAPQPGPGGESCAIHSITDSHTDDRSASRHGEMHGLPTGTDSTDSPDSRQGHGASVPQNGALASTSSPAGSQANSGSVVPPARVGRSAAFRTPSVSQLRRAGPAAGAQ
jgi:hypothetical protein